jgi:hypothetical protein
VTAHWPAIASSARAKASCCGPCRGPVETQDARFHCVPNNPAIGWAFISLVPKAGAPRPLIVNGMFTDAAGRIVILLLNKTDAQGPVYPPFAAQRIL